jgi:hypothetical protein
MGERHAFRARDHRQAAASPSLLRRQLFLLLLRQVVSRKIVSAPDDIAQDNLGDAIDVLKALATQNRQSTMSNGDYSRRVLNPSEDALARAFAAEWAPSSRSKAAVAA